MRLSMIAAMFLASFAGGLLAAAVTQSPASLPAERVTGIGGVFLKAQDPKALAVWYRDTLGIPVRDDGPFAILEWREPADAERVGMTVWSLFPSDTTYFAPSEAPVMINYRVRDLDRMLAQVRALGVKVDPKISEEFNGRFAWIVDPEGNKIELWEPKAGY